MKLFNEWRVVAHQKIANRIAIQFMCNDDVSLNIFIAIVPNNKFINYKNFTITCLQNIKFYVIKTNY